MIRTLLVSFAAAGLALASGPAWDSSGNGLLSGTYNFRQVQYASDGSGGISHEIAYFGSVSFDGAGTYTLSGNNTLVTTGGTVGIPSSGTYSVAASGYGFLSNPIAARASVYFLVANQTLIGSSTENGGSNGTFVNDLFIATPATATFTNSSLSGAYTLAGFVPGNDPSTAADVSLQFTANGAGSLTSVSISGYRGAGMNFPGTVSSGMSYAFSNGVASITFPIANPLTAFYSGPETLYMSPDSNFVYGGSPNGYDMFVGVRNPTIGTPSLTSGLYYELGVDEDESQFVSDEIANIDSYYGVFNAVNGTIVGHERLLYAGSSAESATYTTSYPPGSYTNAADVGQLDPSATVQYTVGAGGIRIGFGIGPWLGIEVAVPAAPPVPSGAAFIDPTGVVNTASSAPFTAGISPGEFITLYNGVNLSGTSTCWTAGPPYPATLGGVQVMIDNIAAPIYCVGAQITVIVPYEVSASPIASIQVLNGNVSSNIATAYVHKTTPGVFTVPAGGVGLAAAQHGDYSLITPNNPAQPGEEIVIYLSGLGSVFPLNGVPIVDGAAAGPKGQTIVSNVAVDVAGFGSTSIPYAGLTPGTAGLYQINFQVPLSAPAGNQTLAVVGPDSFSSQALLPVGSGAAAHSLTPENETSRRRRVLPRLSSTPAGVQIGTSEP